MKPGVVGYVPGDPAAITAATARTIREHGYLGTTVRILAPLKAGEQEGVPYAIEGAAVSPLDTPERVRDVLEAVGSPALGFNADPVNFVRSLDELYDNAALTNRLFDLCGRWVI